MGRDCYGWVEAQGSPLSPDASHSEWWRGIVHINDLVDRNSEAYDYFFGAIQRSEPSLAGHRGFPPKMSDEALDEAGDLTELGNPADVADASWVLWSEIQASDWQTRPELGRAGWRLLFTLMADLAAYYGDDHVRLVIWFTY